MSIVNVNVAVPVGHSPSECRLGVTGVGSLRHSGPGHGHVTREVIVNVMPMAMAGGYPQIRYGLMDGNSTHN
jgi:hypothetical protein